MPGEPSITETDGQITISADEGATIYYTTDESNPTVGSTPYTRVFTPADGVSTIRAVAVKNSLYSDVATYTVQGTGTLVVSNVPDGETVSVTCTSSSGGSITVTPGANNT